MSTLLLHVIRVSAFQGIDTESPLLIEYPLLKGDARPIVRILGDERSGRTSLINFLLYVTGNKISYKFQDILSRERCILAGEIEFSVENERWRVEIGKHSFQLFRHLTDLSEDDSCWMPQGSQSAARETLKRLIGSVAVNPMKLQELDGKRQVSWLYAMLNIPKEVVDEEKRLRYQLSIVTRERTEAFKDLEANRRFLEDDPMYQNWEEMEERYRLVQSMDPIKKKLDQATAGQRAILYEEYDNAIIYNREQSRWFNIKVRKTHMDQFETAVQELDRKKDAYNKALRDLLKKVIPGDIPGLEVVTQDAIDGRKAGVYINGKPPTQVSESELYEAYYALCKACKVTMVLVDNVRFGKESLKTLNSLAKSGVYVLVTDLAPGKELSAAFVNELKR